MIREEEPYPHTALDIKRSLWRLLYNCCERASNEYVFSFVSADATLAAGPFAGIQEPVKLCNECLKRIWLMRDVRESSSRAL